MKLCINTSNIFMRLCWKIIVFAGYKSSKTSHFQSKTRKESWEHRLLYWSSPVPGWLEGGEARVQCPPAEQGILTKPSCRMTTSHMSLRQVSRQLANGRAVIENFSVNSGGLLQDVPCCSFKQTEYQIFEKDIHYPNTLKTWPVSPLY